MYVRVVQVTSVLCLLLVLEQGRALYNCSSVRGCDCAEKPNRAYELECPSDRSLLSSQINIVVERDKFSLKCGGLAGYKNFIPQLEPVETTYLFEVEECDIPEMGTISEVMLRLGAHNPEIFQMVASNITNITRDNLKELARVKRLYLKANRPAVLPGDLLYDMHDLVYVEITNHEQLALPPHFFGKTRRIAQINMGQNNLGQFPDKLFANLSELKTLNLWANKLTHIEAGMFEGLTNLTILELSVNELRSLPVNLFEQLPQLQELSVRKNLLDILPEGLFHNNFNLQILKLDDNPNLKFLPDYFLSNLIKLTKVSISGCNLQLLPTNMFSGSTNLLVLNMSKNNLTIVQKSTLKDTQKLEEVNLQSNVLNTIEDFTFSKMKKLRVLRLGSNNLSLTANTFDGLSQLEELYLPYNNLKMLNYRGFLHFQKLRTIDLSHNELTLISPLNSSIRMSVLSHLNHLEKIYLEYNNITDLFWDWRITLRNVSEINLTYNKMHRLQVDDLNFVSNKDVILYLEHNLIETIDMTEAEVLWVQNHELNRHSDWKRVVRVFLADNPLRCDCGIYDLVRYLRQLMNPVVRNSLELVTDGLECAAPPSVRHQQPAGLAPHSLTCELEDGPRPAACATRPLQYRSADNMLIVNCSHMGLMEPPNLSDIAPYGKNIELHLEDNNLTHTPEPNMGYDRVLTLNLAHNHITGVRWLPPNITKLYLHDNDLTTLGYDELNELNKTSLRNVTFHNNPWRCDCNIVNFTKYLQENFNRVVYLNNVTCNATEKALTTLTASEVCEMEVDQWIATGIGLGAAGLLIGLLVAMFFKYQQEVKVWLYAHNLCMYFLLEEELDKDKLYDAFVSYSHKDEDFVVNELVVGLESGPTPFKLCLHYRNWQPGELIAANIARSVAESRRTLVVLSPAFLRSEWGKMEFRTAHVQALSEGRARVIVIIVGDVGPVDELEPELRAYLTTNTYVKWGDPWFWDKLRYALPHRTVKPRPVVLHQPVRPDKLGLVLEPCTPPSGTTPPADHLYLDPLLLKPPPVPRHALNVALINGTLVNGACNDKSII